jgi:hypothetical protein
MASQDALRVVLGLRRLKQDTEERRLSEILRDKAKRHAELELVAVELKQITAARLRQVQQIQYAIQHQESEARFRKLTQYRADVLAKIAELEQQRVQQMSVYVAARRDREVIEEVEGKRKALREAAMDAREQKRIEELFLARRVRHSDTSVAE